MNKRELITRIKCLDEQYLKEEFVLDLIEQLDEPQKPVVPQFVADWIEECKNDDFHLFGANGRNVPTPEKTGLLV